MIKMGIIQILKLRILKKGKSGDSYLRKRIKYDNKRMFSNILDNYNLSKEDKKFVIDFINKHKKKK